MRNADFLQRFRASLLVAARKFAGDTQGNVALLFGLSSIMIFTAMGAGLDLSRAYLARQKLSQVATMACQYASRPAILDTATSSYGGSNGGGTYSSSVNSFITTTWQSQNVNLTQTQGTPFTYTQNGPADVVLKAVVPTSFMQIAGFQTIPIAVSTHCYDTPSTIPQTVPNGNSPFVLKESFEANGTAGGYTFYKPNGTIGAQTSPTGYSSAIGYTGATGTQWHVVGYCLEQDSAGLIKSSVPDGGFSVELDCDNGSNSKGNSSIATQAYLSAGSYELRYNYASRVSYPNYSPAYICGTTASDVSWASDTNSSGGPVANALRTNQINVYLDLNNSSTNAPPTHTTMDGAVSLAGSNLIDMCVYSVDWVERSVSVTVTTPGYYWLSFAADGTSDSYGGQLDNIRLCRISCPNSVKDNFPSEWSAGQVLFEDPFEAMTVKGNYGSFSDVDISTSNGTAGTSASGWPSATATGWRISQVNQVTTIAYQPVQGQASIELDADMNKAGVANSNRTITRPFLLMPGYYSASYYYRSNATFASLGSAVKCGATPTAAGISTLTGTGTGNTAYSGGGNGTWPYDTNIVAMFMSHDLMASDPNPASWMTVATYTNPDGTSTSSPTVADSGISLTSYNAAQPNPLLDICGYAGTWQTRTATIKILKPAYYWLTFAALGTSDNVGGSIDDVKLAALGSLYMSSPPSNPVTIPVPNPQPASTVSFTGFTITADPLTP